MIKFLFSWKGLVFAALLFFVITAPNAAAAKAHNGLDGLQKAGASLSEFFSAL